ncbi:PhoH family protein [Shewanella violacea]|uniref:PhoH family protein n=1 Tax=Shewanella violacea (strain JCM 10179 / CIP 106290 / LMG 19151 / DSS12) TaxID=637905 RepID=D4ZEU4_SHEVD|nr:PhoH family protein [Shewanella violacea]BAJ00324.1 PhoH family protein [Shewanella violacea DSS12]
MEQDDRKLFVLDTNVLLHEPLAIYSFKEHDVVIPMTVLEELDQIKDRKRDVSRDARVAIRALEDILGGKTTPEQILQGVKLPRREDHGDACGTLSIFPDHQLEMTHASLPDNNNDNRIINTALHLQKIHKPRNVVLVTKDINMRLKAKGAGIKLVEDYRTDQLIDDIRFLTTGFHQFKGDFWERKEHVSTESHGRHTVHTIPVKEVGDENFYINQYLIDEDSNFCARVLEKTSDDLKLLDLGKDRLLNIDAWGIRPKNIYQGMAMQALLDPEIDLVILTGPAGCGKTLLAMAAALEMVVERGLYDKIIVTRNTPEIAESIGFLPGTEEEKMTPWLAAITDTLEVLHKNDVNPSGSMNYIMDKANVQFKSINFMRGRSIQNSVVILDECQNLTASQIKTMITRMGEGTKLICSGNLSQIDSNYLTAVTSGLTYIVERFKDFEGSANIYLNGVVRSRLAEFAEENL